MKSWFKHDHTVFGYLVGKASRFSCLAMGHYNFFWMKIHLPAILMVTRGTGFWSIRTWRTWQDKAMEDPELEPLEKAGMRAESQQKSPSALVVMDNVWLVVLEHVLWLSRNSWECHHPNWLSLHHFSEGLKPSTSNQIIINHHESPLLWSLITISNHY